MFRRSIPALSIFAFTLALRSITAWRVAHSAYGVPSTGDMRFYAEWARRIADGQLTDFQAFYGQPLYAYLLGGLFALTGFQPLVIGLLQSCVDAATAVLIFQIGRIAFPSAGLGGHAVAAVAAVGWALFVPAAAYVGLLIPAAWTTFAWWFSVWWLLARSGEAQRVEWFLAAALVGIIAMVSATILFVLPLFAAKAIARRAITPVVAIMAGVILGTAPAWLHNYVVARDAVFLSAHSGVNFWIGNNPEANGYPRVPRELPSEQAALLDHSIKVAEAASGRQLRRSEVSAFWSAKAWDFIATDPWRWVRLLGTKMRNFWSAFEYDDLSSITALQDAGMVSPGSRFAIVAALGLPGLLLALRLPRGRIVAFAVLLQMAALLAVFVNERYRLAAAPGLLLLSAFFLSELWRAATTMHWSRLAVAGILVGCSTYFVAAGPKDRPLWSLNDYKTARRHIMAGEFSSGEARMRRALETMLGRQPLHGAVANGFAEIAQEQTGDRQFAAALATIDAALRINPADARLLQLRARLATAVEPNQ